MSAFKISRRDFALTGLATLMAASSGAFSTAFAQSAFDQAEWKQNYDAATSLKVVRSSTPVLSPLTLQATEQAIESYRQIVSQGGFPEMPAANLKLGSKGPAVAALRRRLIASGDLNQAAGGSPIFDSFVEAGVKRFQERHGLMPTGIVNQNTVTAMNVPAAVRLRQLETNVVRLRSYAGNLGERFVVANIPAALVETVENGQVMTRHAAGVGKIDRQSPVMTTRATDINFNPFWTVPASIIKKDLIPKMQADPNYLTDNKIRIYNKAGQEIAPSAINWRSDEATHYMFRQDPGGDFNSLGVVRINIGNPYGVYMHDTPAKGIFGDDFRFVSSGCMRVQNVRDYVTWLLKDTPGWTREQIDAAIESGQRVDARLAQPVPVYWVYITAWATPEGIVQFRDDIYNKDGLGGAPVASMASSQIGGPEEEMQ
ncbi:murein L,D-transpeptidase [Alsobacter soli]|uniref:Murein L,D-transpeptidase n=1 Tax=Alsobacter soli TaxID=2109933 RepID=A0A2T1HM83_9HYPH|nr:murein L,D-transpeptidase [Alsobacter soli]